MSCLFRPGKFTIKFSEPQQVFVSESKDVVRLVFNSFDSGIKRSFSLCADFSRAPKFSRDYTSHEKTSEDAIMHSSHSMSPFCRR